MRLALATVLALGLVSGCGTFDSCPDGQIREEVHSEYTSSRSPHEYVCVPAPVTSDSTPAPTSQPSPTDTSSPPGTLLPPGGESPAPAPPVDAGAAPACGVQSAGTIDVRLVPKDGPTPAPSGAGTPPDGTYVLVQANAFGGADAGGALQQIRATVTVSGAVLALGLGSTGAVESSAVTLAGGTLTTVCQVAAGPASGALLPGVGGTERAAMGWNGATLDIVLTAPAGTIELVFTPA